MTKGRSNQKNPDWYESLVSLISCFRINRLNQTMKILTSILVVIGAILLCVSMAISYVVESKDLIPQDEYESIILVSYKLKSEPVIMILVGLILIGIAGIGRKRLSKEKSDLKRPMSLASSRPPFPDPVPWKKDA